MHTAQKEPSSAFSKVIWSAGNNKVMENYYSLLNCDASIGFSESPEIWTLWCRHIELSVIGSRHIELFMIGSEHMDVSVLGSGG